MQQTILAVHAESDRLAERLNRSADNTGGDDTAHNILLTAALDVAELDYFMSAGYLDLIWFANAVAT